MVARTVPRLALAIMITAVAGCVPGHRGWSCSSNGDCDAGLVCTDFGSSVFDNHYCVSPGTTRIGSRDTYGWFAVVLVDGFAGVFGLIVVVIAGSAAVESLTRGWKRSKR